MNRTGTGKWLKAGVTAMLLLFFSTITPAQYNVNAYLNNAKKNIAEEKFTEAIRLLNICLEAQPGNNEAFFYRGGCKYFLSDYLGAEEDFTMALSSYSVVYFEACHYRSQVRYQLGNFSGAIADLNKVLERQTEDPKLYLERAFSELSLNDFNAALTDCKKAATYNYKGEDLYLCNGTAEYALGNYDAALVDYFKTVSINPKSVDGYVRKGMANFKLKNYCESKADYDTALAMDSLCTFAYYNRAELEMESNNNKAAIKDYSKVLEFEPRNAAVYFNRATVYANTDKLREALADFDKVLLINPKNIQATFNRAKIKQALRDYNGALEDYDKVISLYPYFMEAYYNKSQIKNLLNDPAGAKKELATAKMMTEVFNSKTGSQIHRDSLALSKLTDLNSGFTTSAASMKTDSVGIGIRPLFYLTIKEADDEHLVYTALTETFNKNSKVKIGISNKELTFEPYAEQPDKTAAAGKTSDNISLFLMAVKKSNASLLNDAETDLNKAISGDSAKGLMYFARAINTCREIEMLNTIDHPYYINNSKQEINDNSKNRKIQSAIDDFTKVIELQPECEYAYFNRAFVKCMLHDYNGAAVDYEKATQVNSNFAEAFYNEGIILYYLNYREQACSAFSKSGQLGIMASYAFIKKYCADVSR